MFEKIKAVIKRMLDAKDVQKVINQSIGLSSNMRTAINDWNLIYKNSPPWSDNKESKLRLLNLGKAISKELARLVLLECKVRVDNCESVDAVMQNVFKDIRPHFEKALAKGGMAFKPYISHSGNIEVDFVDAENFFPTGYDSNGDIYAAVFISKLVFKDEYYTRLEKHEYNYQTKSEHIQNFAYRSKTPDALGTGINLEAVPSWSKLVPEATVSGIESPLFSYFKVPFANTIDDESPLGVSVFEDSIDLLEDAERLQLQTAGVIKPWENRAWYLGESEDKAKEMCQPSDEFFE